MITLKVSERSSVLCLLFAALFVLLSRGAEAAPRADLTKSVIDNYVRPFAATNNFSGVVLVGRKGVPIYAKAYGFADRDGVIPNTLHSRFHIASMSMQFTAAAALRLVAEGTLSLDTPVSAVVPDYPNGTAIRLRHLLTQTSGIADINAQDSYADVLKAHQTPGSLVAKVRNLPPLRQPGTFDREEHSAFNLLALIIEMKTGLPFGAAVQKLVFSPLDMADSGIDEDQPLTRAATGYEPAGLYGLKAAQRIHWSAKAGNASAYTTALDELKFIQGLYHDSFLPAHLRAVMFDPGARVGYGWFKSNSARFGQPVYSMNGRAPGFASAVVFVPQEALAVIVLSNVYASVPAEMANEITAIALRKPFDPLSLRREVEPASLAGLPAEFRFPGDFYQPNAVVRVRAANGTVSLDWPNGDTSVLIPTGKDHYIDRAYWVPVVIVRDREGHIVQLRYDRFVGERRRAQSLTGSVQASLNR